MSEHLTLRDLRDVGALPDCRPQGVVRTVIVYNPLDVSERAVADLEWTPTKTLAEYLDGLPEEVEWYISINGAVEPVRGEWHLRTLREGDSLVVIPVPEGGGSGGGKTVLRMVAMIVLAVVSAVVAPYATAAMGVTTAAGFSAATVSGVTALVGGMITAVGGMLISALVPPPEQDDGGNYDDSPTFGFDGAKNTAEQGIPVPVLYGKHRAAGNVVQQFTENGVDANGKQFQYLYMQTVLSEGPVESIFDIQVNDQPVANYTSVEVRHRTGEPNQDVDGWFSQNVALYNVSATLTEEFYYYETLDNVDRLRVDVVAPTGITNLNLKSGGRDPHEVPIQLEYRKIGDEDWLSFNTVIGWLPIDGPNPPDGDGLTGTYGSGDIITTPINTSGFKLDVKYTGEVLTGGDEAVPTEDYSYTGYYRLQGQTTWKKIGTRTGTLDRPTVERNGNYLPGTHSGSFVLDGLPEGTYEIKVERGGTRGTVATTASYRGFLPLKLQGNTTSALRWTFTTDTIEQGRYEVRGKRLTPPDPSPETSGVYDAAMISDIGEISVDPVAYNHTAWLGIRVKLDEQIGRLNKVTALVKGRVLNIYDENGNVTAQQWSDNPADIALDIMLNTRYAGAIQHRRVDFAMFKEWRDYCAANGLTCNIIFDWKSNIYDALREVMRCGRAQLVASGSRMSVAIESRADPVMMFGVGNIRKGTFSLKYLPFEDRINEIDVIFNDEENDYRAKTIRVINDRAQLDGAEQKTMTAKMPGIVTADRAHREAKFLLEFNNKVVRSATWEAPIEAMGCTVGDVVLVQHDMVDWGEAGRFASGSTDTVVKLDREVSIENGKTYKVLTLHDAVKRYDINITSVIGTSVYTNDLPDPVDRVRNFKIGSEDYKVEAIYSGGLGNPSEIVLEARAAGQPISGTAELWDTDVIEERTSVTAYVDPGDGGPMKTDTITVDAAFSQAPAALANFMFGESTVAARPFRVLTIDGSHEDYRAIEAIEYVDSIYDENFGDPAVVDTDTVERIGHVQNLAYSQRALTTSYDPTTVVNLTWEPPVTGFYEGAHVKVSLNGQPYRTVRTASNGITQAEFEVRAGDEVVVRVVAFDGNGSVANEATAPSVTFTADLDTVAPDPVTGVTYDAGVRDATIHWTNPTDADLRHVRIETSADTNYANAVAIGLTSGSSYQINGLAPGSTTYVWLVAVDTSGNASSPVGPTAVTASEVVTDEIGDGAVDEGKVADSAITATKIAANAVTADKIEANAVTADKIAANAITAGKIAADAITSSKIVAGEISVDRLRITNPNNLAENPGFELGNNGSWSATGTFVVQSSGLSRTGGWSAVTSGTGTHKLTNAANVSVSEGDSIFASAWYKASGSFAATALRVRVTFTLTDDTTVSDDTISITSGYTTGWSKIEGTVTAPANAKTARVELVADNVTAGAVRFDDVETRLATDTAQLMPNSVSLNAGAFTATETVINFQSGGSERWDEIQSVTKTSAGENVYVNFGVRHRRNSALNSYGIKKFRLKKDGAVKKTLNFSAEGDASGDYVVEDSYFFDDEGTTGSITYTLEVLASTVDYRVSDKIITTLEFKR